MAAKKSFWENLSSTVFGGPDSRPKPSPASPPVEAEKPQEGRKFWAGLKAAWKGYTEDHSVTRLAKSLMTVIGASLRDYSRDQKGQQSAITGAQNKIDEKDKINKRSTAAKGNLSEKKTALKEANTQLTNAKKELEKTLKQPTTAETKQRLEDLEQKVEDAKRAVKNCQKAVEDTKKNISALSTQKDKIRDAEIRLAAHGLKDPATPTQTAQHKGPATNLSGASAPSKGFAAATAAQKGLEIEMGPISPKR